MRVTVFVLFCFCIAYVKSDVYEGMYKNTTFRILNICFMLDAKYYSMQRRGAFYIDLPRYAFAVETSDTLDGKNDITAYYEKRSGKVYIFSELPPYNYALVNRNYTDCDKTAMANGLLIDISTNKNAIRSCSDRRLIKIIKAIKRYRRYYGLYSKFYKL